MNKDKVTALSDKLNGMTRRDVLKTGLASVAVGVGSSLLPSSVFAATKKIKTYSYDQVRSRLLRRQEIAFLDVREEIPHAEGHPLFSASFPLGNIELNAYTFLPRKQMPIVVIDKGDGLAERAAEKFIEIGYTDVGIFQGGVDAWANAGGQLFQDINVPSKSFGEFMAEHKKTPSMTPTEVNALRTAGKVVILDVRRPDEYATFRIPGAISEPGSEVVRNFASVVPDDTIQVITNCAGRTRGLIWAQTLRNVGVKNPVSALKGGTIQWYMDGVKGGFELEEGSTPPNTSQCQGSCNSHFIPGPAARSLADQARVKRAKWANCLRWQKQQGKTTYFFDVRSETAYAAGHLDGFRSAPGGEVIQELMMFAPSRGARIVLVDDDGVQANIAGSWLAQMNCDVWVLDDAPAFTTKGIWQPVYPATPNVVPITAKDLAAALPSNNFVVIDLSPYRYYTAGHIPGAWFALRSQLSEAAVRLPLNKQYVLTDRSGLLAAYAAPELQQILPGPVYVLKDKDVAGNAAWKSAGFAFERGATNLASPPIDRFQRPYEAPEGEEQAPDVTFDIAAIQRYLSWLAGSKLLDQLTEDGTSGFHVI